MAVVGALPPRGPVGAAAARQRGDAGRRSSASSRPGMRFITWVPADEDVMAAGLPAASRATGSGASRSPIRPTTPAGCGGVARLAREEGVEEIVVGLTYSISDVAHARVLRRARRRARRTAPTWTPLPQGSGRAADAGRRARAGAAVPRGGRASGRSSCTATARSGSRRSSTWKGCARGSRCSTPPWRRWRAARRTRPSRRRCATSRRRGTRTARPRGARRRVRALPRDRARARAAVGRAAGVRRRRTTATSSPGGMVSTTRRMLDGAAAARAVRRSAGGGRPRARRDGLPDHRHARVAVRGDAGGAERDRAASAGRRLRRDGPLLPRPLRRAGGARRPAGGRTGAVAAARRRSCAISSRSSLEGARARFGAGISDEELLLRLTMPAEQVDAMVASAPATGGREPRPVAGATRS